MAGDRRIPTIQDRAYKDGFWQPSPRGGPSRETLEAAGLYADEEPVRTPPPAPSPAPPAPPSSFPIEQWRTPRQVAQDLGVSVWKVFRMMKSGRLQAVNLFHGRRQARFVIRPEDVTAALPATPCLCIPHPTLTAVKGGRRFAPARSLARPAG
jgi:hypothetical protein